jgi:hypothetical protein
MADLYNRIHRTCAEFTAVADRIAALDPGDHRHVMTAFDSQWARLELIFGNVESFRLADRSRRTRFLLDLIAAEERDSRAGRIHAATGIALLALFLRGVKYATREESDRMWQRIERLRDAVAYPFMTGAGTPLALTPTFH